MPGLYTKLPPVEHHQVDVHDLRLHVAEVRTPGRPMILLHGIGMDWRVWQAMSRRLAVHFHLYMVDLRGHGDSAKPLHGYTLPHYAADIEDLMDRMGLHGAVLVGSSLGGAVAAAVEAPADIVTHRVLVDPPLTGGRVRDPDMYSTILRLKHEPVPALAGYLGAFNPSATPFYLTTMSEMWHRAADGVIEDMLAAPDSYFDLSASLRAHDSPTLIMRADPARGGILTEEQARAAAEILPHGSVAFVSGAGHAIHAFKPVEFARLVFEFTGAAQSVQ